MIFSFMPNIEENSRNLINWYNLPIEPKATFIVDNTSSEAKIYQTK